MNLRNVSENQELAILSKENPDLQSLLQIYPHETVNLLINNKEKLAEIAACMSNATAFASVNTIVMKCGTECIYKDICIFCKNGLQPTGYPCPLEKKIISQMESEIRVSLGIDSSDPIEMEMLWDLIDAKILDMRASGALKDGRLIQVVEQKIGANIVSRQEMSPNVELKLELKRLKANVIDAFVASRRAKKKYGFNNDGGTLEKIIQEAAKKVESLKKDKVEG